MISNGIFPSDANGNGEFSCLLIGFNIADVVHIQHTHGKEPTAQGRQKLNRDNFLRK